MQPEQTSRELVFEALSPVFKNKFIAYMFFPFHCMLHFTRRMWCNRFPEDHELVKNGTIKAWSVASFGLVGDRKVFWIHPKIVEYMKKAGEAGAYDDIPVGCLEGKLNG